MSNEGDSMKRIMKATWHTTAKLAALGIAGGMVASGCGAGADASGGEAEAPGEIGEARAALSSCAWGDPSYIRLGDWNADGKKDILSPNGVQLCGYVSAGHKLSYTSWPTADPNWGAAGYTFVGDFNGDGRADSPPRTAGRSP